MKDSLSDANEFSGCSKDRLMAAVKSRLADADVLGIGVVEKYVDSSPVIKKTKTDYNSSIYQDINLFDGLALHVYGLGSLIRINNNFIGSDKLGHFFFDGWKYYEKAFGPRGRGKENALKYGENTESGLFGYMMTGIFSYADLSANFNGLRFWNEIIGDKKDPLTNSKVKPFFRCERNRWALQKKFNISNYVDASWDEGMNCNKYENKKLGKAVAKRISTVENLKGCPISYVKCQDLSTKYFNYKKHLLHPNCRETNVSKVSK